MQQISEPHIHIGDEWWYDCYLTIHLFYILTVKMIGWFSQIIRAHI